MYEPSKTTRIGLSYRYPITQEMRGNADFTVPAIANRLTTDGRCTDMGARAVVKLTEQQ